MSLKDSPQNNSISGLNPRRMPRMAAIQTRQGEYSISNFQEKNCQNLLGERQVSYLVGNAEYREALKLPPAIGFFVGSTTPPRVPLPALRSKPQKSRKQMRLTDGWMAVSHAKKWSAGPDCGNWNSRGFEPVTKSTR